MVTYNPKDWFKLIFQFHKSDTIRILFPTIMLLGAVTAGACYLEEKYVHTSIPSLTIFHQISGFIISLVLVFRINTAYDRWWEGRKLWGTLLNNARNLAIRLDVMTANGDGKLRKELAAQISNFAFILKEHLRNRVAEDEVEFSDALARKKYLESKHKPSFAAAQLTGLTLRVCEKHSVSPNDYLILSDHLTAMIDICGGCERIKNTPIPYSYSLFIKKVIFLYIITMPVTFGLTIGYWSVPLVMIMFYAFASLELISEEIEDPFGTDANDLPTDEIALRIRQNVNEILS